MRVVFEKVRESATASFWCEEVDSVRFSCPYHVHPEIEILHIRGGQGSFVVGDYVGRFAAGDLLLLGSGLPHMLYSDRSTSADLSSGTRLRYVQFRPDVFGEGFWRMRELAAAERLIAQSAHGWRYAEKSAERGIEAFDRLWSATGAERLGGLIGLLDTLASVPADPIASPGYAPAVTHRQSERLNRALQYINRNLTEAIALDAVAAEAGLSPQAFCRFFRKMVGMSCIDYVISLRISLASRLLLESDRTVAAIAFLVGFNNLSNFNRQFRRLRGLTPTVYRHRTLSDPTSRR